MRLSVAALLLRPLAAASREEAAAAGAVPRRLPRASASGAAVADPAPSPHRSGVPMSTYDPANILDDDCSTEFDHVYDSGFVGTAGASYDVAHVGAESLQLDLGKSVLAGDAKLILNGVEELNASALATNGWSEVLRGAQITVTLRPDTGGAPSRLVVKRYVAGGVCDAPSGQSICGTTDDRVASTDYRQGRIGGCTGWLISEDVFIQAGHCGTPSTSTRLHFTFGVSSAPVEDQYAVEDGSYTGNYGGVGNDWGVGRLLPNSQTGLLPGVAQSSKCGSPGCGWYDLGPVPATTVGNSIRITGYGVAAVASRSQKTHVGGLVGIGGTSLSYVPDTTGGNSGSPVVHEQTGLAIGVHTHGGCTATGGSNKGTRIDRADFAAAIDALLGTSPPPPPPPPPAPTAPPVSTCALGADLKVEVLTDNYPGETTWTLENVCEGEQIASGGPYLRAQNTEFSQEVCDTPGEFKFTINDSWGDGICCSHGPGQYKVYLNGNVAIEGGNFNHTETNSFGSCPAPPTAPPTSPPTAPPTSPPTAPPTAPPTSPPTAPPTTPPTAPPTSPPTAPPTNPPNPTPPPAGDTTPPGDDASLVLDLFETRFTFHTDVLCVDPDVVAGRAFGGQPRQCAHACAVLVTCDGFVETGDACVLAAQEPPSQGCATGIEVNYYKRFVSDL